MGKVYFIEAIGCSAFKIGVTNGDPKKRMKYLQVSCPCKLRVFGIIESANYRDTETSLHRKFASINLSGEWFSMPAKEAANILREYGGTVLVSDIVAKRKYVPYNLFDDNYTILALFISCVYVTLCLYELVPDVFLERALYLAVFCVAYCFIKLNYYCIVDCIRRR